MNLKSTLKYHATYQTDGYHQSSSNQFQQRVAFSRLKDFSSDSIFSAHNVLFRCRFNTSENDRNLLAICDEDGYVSVFNTRQSQDYSSIVSWRAHNNALFDINWMTSGKQLLTGSADQTCCLWDVERRSHPLQTFIGHSSSIRTVNVCEEDQNMFATGSRDGSVLIFDMRNRRRSSRFGGPMGTQPVLKIPAAHKSTVTPPQSTTGLRTTSSHRRSLTLPAPQSSSPSTSMSARGTPNSGSKRKCDGGCTLPKVTSVLFSGQHQLISASEKASQGIRMWDIRHVAPRYEPIPPFTFHFSPPTNSEPKKERGFSSLCMDRYRNRFYAAFTGNVIYEFALSNQFPYPSRQLVGGSVQSFYVDIACSPNSDFLVSGSSDGSPCVWNIRPDSEQDQLHPVLRLGGHSQEVTGVGWGGSVGNDVLSTCEDGYWRLWVDAKFRRVPKGTMTAVATMNQPAVTRSQTSPIKQQHLLYHHASNESSLIGPNLDLCKTPTKRPALFTRPPNSSPFSNQLSESRKRKYRTKSESTSASKSSPMKSPIRSPSRKSSRVVCSPRKRVSPKGPFYYRTPTTNLPNSVLDRFKDLMQYDGGDGVAGPITRSQMHHNPDQNTAFSRIFPNNIPSTSTGTNNTLLAASASAFATQAAEEQEGGHNNGRTGGHGRNNYSNNKNDDGFMNRIFGGGQAFSVSPSKKRSNCGVVVSIGGSENRKKIILKPLKLPSASSSNKEEVNNKGDNTAGDSNNDKQSSSAAPSSTSSSISNIEIHRKSPRRKPLRPITDYFPKS